MNRALAREIVAYLREPAPQEAHFDRWRKRRDWGETLEWLDHSGLALVLWDRLVTRGAAGAVPSGVGRQLERNLADHRLRIAAMVDEFDSINACLEESGIQYAALKGFALIPEFAPDIFLRTTYDYDYLLPRDSMERAQEGLRAAGYVHKPNPDDHALVYFHKASPPRLPLCRDDLYSAAFPRTVELHYLFWDQALVKIPLELAADPLARLRVRNLGARGGPSRFYALSEEDELIFQALHAFRHILRSWCRLSTLLDIAYFLNHRASDTVFWNQFLERLGSSRPLFEITAIIFLLAGRVFGAAIPPPFAASVEGRLRSSLRLWVDHYGFDSALCNFASNKFSLLLHREFIRDDADWRAVRRGRLVPLQRPNPDPHSSEHAAANFWAANWKQAIHVARRIFHHLSAGVRYGLEARRWKRIRSRRVKQEGS